jgi:acyl-CoA synthetase (AMP-forming)/AMP-acid ligase II
MNLASLFEIPALIAPDAPALSDAFRSHTYESLAAAGMQGAGALRDLGVGQRDRVGVFATNSVHLVEALIAIAAVGATAVPMNYRAKGPEVAHLVQDSGSKVLLIEDRYRDLIAGIATDAQVISLDAADGWASLRDAAEPIYELVETEPGDLAILLYTSGTTSLPKGVMLTHDALTDYVLGRTEPADGSDQGRMLLAAPLYHIAGVTSLIGAVYGGRTVVLMPQFDSTAWLELVERHEITHSFLVPTMLARILDDADVSVRDLSTLESLTYGAAPMPPPVIRRAIELFPSSVAFSGAYGQTETTSTVAVLGPDDHRLEGSDDEVAERSRRLSSVGRVVDDVEVRIIADGTVAGVDEIGEVQLRTARSMTGYWGSGSSRTADTLDDQGWIHTGDLGYLDAGGYLFLAGRAGDLIIRGGENIAPEEIEAVLYDHPEIVEAGVVGIPDEEWGERVLAVIVRREGSTLDDEALRAYCTERMASYKRPDRFVFVEQLPRTSTGKLLRRDLIGLTAD